MTLSWPKMYPRIWKIFVRIFSQKTAVKLNALAWDSGYCLEFACFSFEIQAFSEILAWRYNTLGRIAMYNIFYYVILLLGSIGANIFRLFSYFNQFYKSYCIFNWQKCNAVTVQIYCLIEQKVFLCPQLWTFSIKSKPIFTKTNTWLKT